MQSDGIDRVATLLRENPPLANSHDDRGNPLVFYLHPGMARLEEMIQLLLAHGADVNARNTNGKTLVDQALGQGWTDFADVICRHGGRTSTDLNAAS